MGLKHQQDHRHFDKEPVNVVYIKLDYPNLNCQRAYMTFL